MRTWVDGLRGAAQPAGETDLRVSIAHQASAIDREGAAPSQTKGAQPVTPQPRTLRLCLAQLGAYGGRDLGW